MCINSVNVYNEKTFNLNGAIFPQLAHQLGSLMSLLPVFLYMIRELHNPSFQTAFSSKCKVYL